MQTPETIKALPSPGGVVFANDYFHIPISPRSLKYLRFHLNSQTYQLEFTKVIKEVKLTAQVRGI